MADYFDIYIAMLALFAGLMLLAGFGSVALARRRGLQEAADDTVDPKAAEVAAIATGIDIEIARRALEDAQSRLDEMQLAKVQMALFTQEQEKPVVRRRQKAAG